MKIFYENEFRNIKEIESDHIHLDDGTVIRNNEIIKLSSKIWISKYSEKKQVKRIVKSISKMNKKIKKI